MTTRRTTRVWLGVGAAALIGTGAGLTTTHTALAHDHSPHAQKSGNADGEGSTPPRASTGSAGEAGEAGEAGGGDSLRPRVRFLRDIGLIRGHLFVGNELVQQGRWEDALPHFHHPIEELYGLVAPVIKERKNRQFDSQLKALAQAVKSKRADAYAAAFKLVDERMTAIEKMTLDEWGPRPAIPVETIVAMLRSAAGEYKEAIEDGRISKPVEYQDSRGFVWYAATLLDRIAPELEKKDKEALASLRAAYAKLQQAWPAAVPPLTPVKDADAVSADVSVVELAASPFLN